MPFVSVTDFTDPTQVRKMRMVLDGLGSNLTLGVGVMMSRKTLNGLPTKWTKAFPKAEDIEQIFLPNPGLFNVLHYADFDRLSTTEDLYSAAAWGGDNVHAIQLDMVWPSMAFIDEFKHLYRVRRGGDIKIILQVNTPALEQCSNDPHELVERLLDYYGSNLVDYVLLDKSHGRGIPMDADELLPYVGTIARALPKVGMVIAGGLGPQTVHRALPIIARYPNVSIDAQGKLRPSGNALDPLDFGYASRYLMRADGIYQMFK